MENINLIMYREPNRTNFGDELSIVILKKLFEKYNININLVLNKNQKYNICFIGSLISWSNINYNDIFILGSGIRKQGDKIIKSKNMKIYSIRGPLSRSYLEKYKYNVPNIFGDPALLLPKFYKPNIIDICKNKIGIVGHLTNYDKYNIIPENFILINPTWKWDKVVDYIVSCKLILSSSLHGLIISDAYNIPNIWLNEYPLNEGEFKFNDYFKSQNRDIYHIKNIEKYKNVKSYSQGNTINLNNIESAFINMCLDLNLIKFSHYEALNDKFIYNYFNNKRDGYFIECGSCDGIHNSSCYFLEKYCDWKGICIEANYKDYEILKKNRKSICISNPISDISNKNVEFIRCQLKWLSGIKSNILNDNYRINKFKDGYNIIETNYIKTVSLYDILNLNNSPLNIDCLCMDIEGSEFDVLNGFFNQNNNKYNIKLIIFEGPCCYEDFKNDLPNINYKFNNINETPIYKLLIKNNYNMIKNPYIPKTKKTEFYFIKYN